jgi:ABC-type sulfate transport system substrate-binding protein
MEQHSPCKGLLAVQACDTEGEPSTTTFSGQNLSDIAISPQRTIIAVAK